MQTSRCVLEAKAVESCDEYQLLYHAEIVRDHWSRYDESWLDFQEAEVSCYGLGNMMFEMDDLDDLVSHKEHRGEPQMC